MMLSPVFSYLHILPGTSSMPHEIFNKSISRILLVPAFVHGCHSIAPLHPLCHFSPCVPSTGQHQLFIASLFFYKLSAVAAISLHLLILVTCIHRRKGTV